MQTAFFNSGYLTTLTLSCLVALFYLASLYFISDAFLGKDATTNKKNLGKDSTTNDYSL